MSPAGYSGTPLAKKLGVKPESVLALIDAPRGFRRTLAPLPPRVKIRNRVSFDRAKNPGFLDGVPDLIVWFATSARDLDTRAAMVSRAMGAGLWIAWPKKASGRATDLTENAVRAAGLANGLVDYKVCAIDGVWSGLKFARRKG